MKYTLAVAALLSFVSAEQIEHHRTVTPYIDDQGYVVMQQEMGRSRKTHSKDKPSDEICDGDSADDKQLETESDKNDDIVEDHGFSGSRGHTIRAQLRSDNYMMSNAELNARLNARAAARAHAKDKPSDYICDGDSADDKQIQDTADPADEVVEDFGFSGSRNARGQVRLLQTGSSYSMDRYSDGIANGDHADDKDLERESDPADMIVDFNGYTNAGYAHTPYDIVSEPYKFDNAHYATNNIQALFPDHFATKPRDPVTFTNDLQLDDNVEAPESDALVQLDADKEEYPLNEDHMNLLYAVSKYSDGIANGDSADDKDLESEADPKDMIVDYNGYGNHGYAHTRYDDPEHHYAFDNAHYADNHVKALFPEHFATKPRESVTFTNE